MKQENPASSSYAIFATGGKQYQGIPGKTIAIEKGRQLEDQNRSMQPISHRHPHGGDRNSVSHDDQLKRH